jgi:hypothetical protein
MLRIPNGEEKSEASGSSCTTYMTEGRLYDGRPRRVWTLRGLRFSAAPTNSSNALGTGTLGMLPN